MKNAAITDLLDTLQAAVSRASTDLAEEEREKWQEADRLKDRQRDEREERAVRSIENLAHSMDRLSQTISDVRLSGIPVRS